jgi:hypothetical protein
MEVKALQQILTQFRQMQEGLQKQVETVQVEASAGGGMVTVKMNGQKQLTDIRIDCFNPRPILRNFEKSFEAYTASESGFFGPPHSVTEKLSCLISQSPSSGSSTS